MHLNMDDDLYRRLERRGEETGFETTEEYSLVVLRTVIDELTEAEDDEDDEVRDRLEDLGYLG